MGSFAGTSELRQGVPDVMVFVRLVKFIAHGKVHSTCVSGISLCSTASIGCHRAPYRLFYC